MPIPLVIPVSSRDEPDFAALTSRNASFDCLVIVSENPVSNTAAFSALSSHLSTYASLDAQFSTSVCVIPAPTFVGGRIVSSPTGPLGKDYVDVRSFATAGRVGLQRARDAGALSPLLLVLGIPEADERYTQAVEVTILGALAGLWQPLEAREFIGSSVEPVVNLGFVTDFSGASMNGDRVAKIVMALEEGRRLARDIAGTEPERMSALATAAYIRDAFFGSSVRVDVVFDSDQIKVDYPLMHAVARASLAVQRHKPCVIKLEYGSPADAATTLLFAGKGVVYDTGGADLKVGGHMAGMSRDKGGAAAVAGFVRAVSILRPAGLCVIAELGMVRNSIGSDSFVADEIITSHAGVRVRIGNTDAEGRLVLAELLSHLRERVIKENIANPHIFTIATLTGHACRAVGEYSIAVDNAVAKRAGVGKAIQESGETWGDCFELSTLRRDDFDFVKPRSRADDVLQCNNAPSTMTERGHQFPAAFLAIASGLDRHGCDSERPIAFSHIDIGGSGCENLDWQHGKPSGAPVVALFGAFALKNVK